LLGACVFAAKTQCGDTGGGVQEVPAFSGEAATAYSRGREPPECASNDIRSPARGESELEVRSGPKMPPLRGSRRCVHANRGLTPTALRFRRCAADRVRCRIASRWFAPRAFGP